MYIDLPLPFPPGVRACLFALGSCGAQYSVHCTGRCRCLPQQQKQPALATDIEQSVWLDIYNGNWARRTGHPFAILPDPGSGTRSAPSVFLADLTGLTRHGMVLDNCQIIRVTAQVREDKMARCLYLKATLRWVHTQLCK